MDDLSPYSAPQLSLYIKIAVSLQQHIGHPSLLQLTLPAGPTHLLDRAAPESNLCDHIPPGGCTCWPRTPPVGLVSAKLKGIFPYLILFSVSFFGESGRGRLFDSKKSFLYGQGCPTVFIYSVLSLRAWCHRTTLSYQQPVVKKLPATRWMIIFLSLSFPRSVNLSPFSSLAVSSIGSTGLLKVILSTT